MLKDKIEKIINLKNLSKKKNSNKNNKVLIQKKRKKREEDEIVKRNQIHKSYEIKKNSHQKNEDQI